MLIKFKKSFEKIAMGLLSFMPEEKKVKKLQETINEYESNENWQLYLWKEEEVLGTIGVRLEDEKVVVQHISVNPSYRNQGIGKKMVQAVKELYEERDVCGNEFTNEFFEACKEEE
ncbi:MULTISPECIES: GNAT family N-acetyltransferase [Allobacillus]|uniref:GNAT family N-acetyltransferase n=1 Tax=Allobacillus halotolerans TaxID=570278 RepID=A0ABS6GK16_9BACI|nr:MULTISPECIES: GNAT family N-acetyltransferase [Allobacillus]MBU6079560.1 GNAT family N-acetyltransferase [Allobacillus halotolerans]TSJ68987.1 GNAT family N-acetyltransferase [Allobacillus sp. SKP2-8]